MQAQLFPQHNITRGGWGRRDAGDFQPGKFEKALFLSHTSFLLMPTGRDLEEAS